MTKPNTETDPRYLKGIELFNAGHYFDAHEIWEELWMDCDMADRRFYQSLIHAAVAIYHAGRGNGLGTKRLLGSGDRYAATYANPYRGLDHRGFWQEMHGFLDPRFGSNGTIVPTILPVPQIVLITSTSDGATRRDSE